MNNKRTTKRALLTSVMALVMCVAMLVGTTFAWFTDTASTGVNRIQSGTLDVELYYANNTTAGEGTTWTKITNATLAFNFVKADGHTGEAVLWEPGCTYSLPALKIKNEGSLALKYKVLFSATDTDAANLELAKVLDVTMNDRSAGTLYDVLTSTDADGYAHGTLEGNKETDAITLSVKMRETAGNEYQGLTIGGIAITVVATQLTSEYDSFDNQYDKDAAYPVVDTSELNREISTAQSGTAIQMAAGNFDLAASIPAGVTLAGDGADKTTLIPVDENGTQITTYELSSDNVTLKDLTITTDNAENSKFSNPLAVQGKNVVLDGIHLVRTTNSVGNSGNGVDLKADEGDVTIRNSTINCGVSTNSIPGNILIENSTLTAETKNTYSLSIGASATGTLIVKNSTLQRTINLGQNQVRDGRNLGLQSAAFDGCKFTAKTSGDAMQDRILTGVNTTFTNCEFDSGMKFVANYCTNNPTYTFTNCKVGGAALTAESYSTLLTWDVSYGTVIINGTTVTVS